ncbi:MarR family transcriptional regulator [Sphaerisporangium sp. NPDC051017]|uniref:MarR family winged helix-turn-helix transcriptional regulator n=1 Tax=Sphaerisporangium sp. NPDC051017 TaxID=3154636 RepID=UPI00341B4A14
MMASRRCHDLPGRRPFTVEARLVDMPDGALASVRAAMLGFVGEYLLDFDRAAEAEGLTQAQARVLGFAVQGMSMGEVAHHFGCDPSNVTAKADRLVALGLVERRSDPRDARVKLIVATPEGVDTALRLRDRRTWLAGALARLDDDEIATVQRALDLLGRAASTGRA